MSIGNVFLLASLDYSYSSQSSAAITAATAAAAWPKIFALNFFSAGACNWFLKNSK